MVLVTTYYCKIIEAFFQIGNAKLGNDLTFFRNFEQRIESTDVINIVFEQNSKKDIT